MPIRLIFPPKRHPEDISFGVAMFAKGVALFGFFALLWSSHCLSLWSRSSKFQPVSGTVHHSTVSYVASRVRNVSFDYQVNGRTYTSENLAIGGRPLGHVPEPGPVTVWVNPKDPEDAVLWRRPVEMVFVSLFAAFTSPFLARFIWTNYA